MTINTLTQAQLMWIDVIISTIKQDRFNLKIGDMNYVLGNMVAKFVSSAEKYKISEGALLHVKAMGLNPLEPIHIAKHIYGKKRNTLLEHMIPASFIKKALVEARDNEAEMKKILLNSGSVVIVLRSEDKMLKAAGLNKVMPSNWLGFGDDPVKRYLVAGINIADTEIVHEGPICR